jgi:VWFA-related protein
MISILLGVVLAQAATPAALPERTIAVTVVDDKGNGVEGLTAEDVAVQENGVARELLRLQADRRPLRVAVLVDSSVTMQTSYRLHAVDAVLQFLLRLPEGSQYAVWTTGDRPKKVYGFGNDRAAVARSLQRVIPQGGNLLLDALMEASKELGDKEEDARTAILAVTAMGVGFANYSRDQVVDAVVDSGTMLLAVTVDEGRSFPNTAGFGSDDRIGAVEVEYVLSTAAARTGGVRDSLLSPMGLETALRRLGGELRGRYWLTYRAAGEGMGDVEVTVARPGAKVRVGPALR